jgi:hypothetical protein
VRNFFPISLILISSAFTARATVIYSDVTNYSGSGYAALGASTVGSNIITNVVADDITSDATEVGTAVTSFEFSIVNFNSVSVTVSPLVSFWTNTGTGGGPGTLLGSFTINAVTIGAGAAQLFTVNEGGGTFFVAPAAFWAGLTFDNNNGATGATAAQLNKIGQGIFAPPTVGSSADSFFQGTTPGQQSSNNPAGTFDFFNGNPVADFGWEFSNSMTAAPEPSSVLLVAAGFGLAALLAKRRS